MDFNQANMDRLIEVLGEKLGVAPETLKKEFEQGKFDSALNNMKPSDAQTFSNVLKNPQVLNKVLSAPQAQALYKKLSGE